MWCLPHNTPQTPEPSLSVCHHLDNFRQLTLYLLGLSLNVTILSRLSSATNPSIQDRALPSYRHLLLNDLAFLILSKPRLCTSSKHSIRQWKCTNQGSQNEELDGFSRTTKGQMDASSTPLELQTNGWGVRAANWKHHHDSDLQQQRHLDLCPHYSGHCPGVFWTKPSVMLFTQHLNYVRTRPGSHQHQPGAVEHFSNLKANYCTAAALICSC